MRVADLYEQADKAGLGIQHDCGGYRIVEDEGGGFHYLFPDSGICPTATKKECGIFLLGIIEGRKKQKT